jgi:hypothetical protein
MRRCVKRVLWWLVARLPVPAWPVASAFVRLVWPGVRRV